MSAAVATAMYREMGMTYSGWGRPRLKRANSNRQSAMAAARLVVRFQASKKVLVPSPRLPDLALSWHLGRRSEAVSCSGYCGPAQEVRNTPARDPELPSLIPARCDAAKRCGVR
jgi:hypothetical protein